MFTQKVYFQQTQQLYYILLSDGIQCDANFGIRSKRLFEERLYFEMSIAVEKACLCVLILVLHTFTFM